MFGITLVMHESIRDYIEKNKKHLGMAEKKYLKMSISFYQKFLENLFLRVGDEHGHKMIRDFRNGTIGYSIKSKEKDRLHMDIESIRDLAGGIIEGFCRNCKKQHQECSIRETFIMSDIPVYEESNVCPYYPR
jgi:hypothetical protein